MTQRDYSYEALAAATNCDMEASRGELNVALKSIRAQAAELSDYALADEIHRRAKLYRDVMGDEILLTPPALSKHWKRVTEEAARPRKTEATNQHGAVTECETCGGDRFVVVSTRKPTQTDWMNAHSIKASEDAVLEELAPCPACNDMEVTFWRHDGTRFRTPDAAKVREMLSR